VLQSSPAKVLPVIEERKESMSKVKDPLSYEIWIFRNGQPDPDDDCRISKEFMINGMNSHC